MTNRIVIEELESWYFGDWAAVKTAYPRVPGTIPAKAQYRNPDDIQGGTWEALERILNRAGYFSGGLRKAECARQVARHMNIDQNRSLNFNSFYGTVYSFRSHGMSIKFFCMRKYIFYQTAIKFIQCTNIDPGAVLI